MASDSSMQTLDSVSVESLIRVVPEGQETVFDLLGEGGQSVKTIEVRRRQLQPESPLPTREPLIARAEARDHLFHDLATFAAYIKREAEMAESLENAIVLADVEAREIVCVVDESSESDREQFAFVATEHPLFKPWSAILNKPIPALEFALHCQRLRRTIVEPDGRELALLFSQIRMAKSITVAQGVGKKAINGVMVELDIAGTKQGQLVELPDSITIETPLFIGSEAIAIEIDLLVAEKNDSVLVYATAPDVEAKQIEAFESIVGQIREQSGLLVGLGHVQHRDWNIVPFVDRRNS